MQACGKLFESFSHWGVSFNLIYLADNCIGEYDANGSVIVLAMPPGKSVNVSFRHKAYFRPERIFS